MPKPLIHSTGRRKQAVARVRVVRLVVRHVLLRLVEVLLVERMTHAPDDCDDDALVHLIGNDDAGPNFAMGNLLLGRGRRRRGAALLGGALLDGRRRSLGGLSRGRSDLV